MSKLSPNLDQLLTVVGKGAKGVHQSQLDPKTLTALRGFMAFLVKEGKSEGTARSISRWLQRPLLRASTRATR